MNTPSTVPQVDAGQVVRLGELLGRRPERIEYVTSGAASHVFRVHTADGSLVLKVCQVDRPGLFAREGHALEHLASTGTVHVPAVVAVTQEFLLLEDLGVENGETGADGWYAFGAQLGRLHQVGADAFGYEHDNYIGIWDQQNPTTDDWVEFFFENRVRCFLDAGHNKELLTTADRNGIERLYGRMPSLVPTQRPGLCHGDLWINNLVRKTDGRVFLIDPAVHYGLPEADLAMTQTYEPFPDAFYAGYRTEAELHPGWAERLPLHLLKEQVLMCAQFAHEESLAKLRRTIATFG